MNRLGLVLALGQAALALLLIALIEFEAVVAMFVGALPTYFFVRGLGWAWDGFYDPVRPDFAAGLEVVLDSPSSRAGPDRPNPAADRGPSIWARTGTFLVCLLVARIVAALAFPVGRWLRATASGWVAW